MNSISSKDNQYLKLARSLHQKKGRESSSCFLIEGIRLSEEAVNCGLEIRFALVANTADDRIMLLAQQLEQQQVPLYQVPADLLAGVSATEHTQGIALVAALPQPQPLPAKGHCYALCDGIADPGNLGAIIRSAYAANVRALILTPKCADLYNPKVVRAAMGALFRLPIYRAESDAAALQLTQGRKIYITAADGTDIRELGQGLQQEHLWVLGSEAKGVSAFWRERADQSICLPMRAGAESLNVAAAATVLFYQSFFAEND